MQNTWTEPKVKSFPLESGKDWYIWYRFNNAPKFIKKGINHIPDYDERMAEALALASVIKDKLKGGWVPVGVKAVIPRSQLTFNEAMDFGIKSLKSSVTHKTFLDYSGTVRFFKATAKKMKIDKMFISSCERYHVKMIMDHLQHEKKWTNKNYNKHLGYISAVFSELVEWEHLKTNVVRDIRSKKEIKTEGFIQPDREQKKRIFDHLKNVDYNFYVFCMIEYYLGIRPKEILLLRCGDVNLETKTIRILPQDSKDASYRYVPVLEPILLLLKNFNLTNPDWYLIGRPKAYGCRFFKNEYFRPNPFPIKRDTATRKWKEYVIDGLGINVKCYSLKHAGANAKLRAGMDMKTISQMFGHSDEKITEIYANYINELRFKEAQKIELDVF